MIRRPPRSYLFFFNDTAPTEIYTLSLHDALPISGNGDPALDDWELGLLAADRLPAPVSLTSRFGQHGGLGALRVAAAALDRAGKTVPSATGLVVVHGLARGGCRTALLI